MSDKEDLGFDLPEPAQPGKGRAVVLGLVAIAVIAGAFLASWLPKRAHDRALAEESATQSSSAIKVQVVTPKAKSSDKNLVLPGTVAALEETTVYPRSNGYVSKWHVDIGDVVAEGAVLADIDQPEVDSQLMQAKAQLAQAQAQLIQTKANHEYASTQLDRYTKLAPSGVASQQELDQHRAQFAVQEANVNAAKAAIDAQEANVRRLGQLKSWGRVTAPFAGKVTTRMIERGALVAPTTPLFKITQADPVRVFVQVPQDVAPSVKTDAPAQIVVRELGNRTFDGKIARAAGALDSTTRTMNTEVRVPNPKNELLVGMYVQAALTLPSPHRVYEIPATAVINDAKGMRIAVVDGGKLRLVPIVVERDTGPTVEIATGVTDADRVVKLGSPALEEGRSVDVAP